MSTNIISVSWGDHLAFGEADGRLHTPKSLRHRIEAWKSELGAGIICWRELRSRQNGYVFAGDETRPKQVSTPPVEWDDFAEVCSAAHTHELQAYLYVTLFDEGWPLASHAEREVSYHNAQHARHVSWQSAFSRENPAYTIVDRNRHHRQWGVLCLAYAEVREYFRRKFITLLADYDFDGLFVCLRSQSRPADDADEFGFNDPVRSEFARRTGVDLRAKPFDRQIWRNLRGEFLTTFLSELHTELSGRNVRLAVGVPRSRIIGPPLGNMTLEWPRWIELGLIDELIINQNSCRCPSMWLDLWPMHPGRGYLEDYRDRRRHPTLEVDLQENYAPRIEGRSTRLYVARQWDARSRDEETGLLENPAVSGLVYSSFRFDNPGPLARDDWRR